MIGIVEKDKNYVWLTIDDPEEKEYLLKHFKAIMEGECNNLPAILVRKQKNDKK